MKAYEYNENFKKWYGFDENGIGYIFLENSYENKDIFKSMGAKWNVPIKAWVIDHEVDNYELLPVNVDDIVAVSTLPSLFVSKNDSLVPVLPAKSRP